MNRRTIITILVALVIVGMALAAALLLGGGDKKPDPAATSSPSVVDIGPAPTAQPSPTGTADGGEPGTGGQDDSHAGETEEEHADHDHGTVEDCTTGPVACAEDDSVIRNTAEDEAAAAAVRSAVTPFALAWATIDSAEPATDRATRLVAVGADPAVSTQVSMLARANSTQTGLTAKTTPQNPSRILFMGREGGLLKFQVSLNVDAKYMQPDDSGSFHVAGGALNVYVADNGIIKRVTEKFPTIANLR